jgi:hypothetical protein
MVWREWVLRAFLSNNPAMSSQLQGSRILFTNAMIYAYSGTKKIQLTHDFVMELFFYGNTVTVINAIYGRG